MNKRKTNIQKMKNRRRKVLKNRIFLIVFFIILIFVIKNIWSLRDDKKNEDKFYNLIGTDKRPNEIIEKPTETTEPITDSTTSESNKGKDENEWKKAVKQAISKNSNAQIVFDNFDSLPEDLKRMSGTNPDTIDFVAKYADYSIEYKYDYPDKIYDDMDYPYYIQWDQKWGYQKYGTGIIGNAGCAPTSLSMMLSGIKNRKVTPDEIAKLVEENGHTGDYGTNWDVYPFIAKEYNLEVTQVPNDLNSIKKQLDKGSPIIISVGPGTFTSVSHVMLIVGYDNNNRLKIYDPNNLQNSEKTWKFSSFSKEIKNMWAYSK
ncbi:C39 family peptidase [Miniphocaeibacter massiliensis]|uniref:C39 family peptidase n=1 Tax=Miniphocaeibacter massiliensis TaxID=2041841 RepID=UPI000C1B8B20|nr:C39 family peptidase [Miniphocaeibacter massiliensis]